MRHWRLVQAAQQHGGQPHQAGPAQAAGRPAGGQPGIEAAAQHHFHKSAKKLTKKEAALLAAVLPNPIKRNAGKPSKGVRGVANRILIRMAGMGPYLTCLGR